MAGSIQHSDYLRVVAAAAATTLASLSGCKDRTKSQTMDPDLVAVANSPGWINSTSLRPEDLQGRVIVVDYWSTVCGPCLRAIPELVEIQSEFSARGVVVIGVTSDKGETVQRFFHRRFAQTGAPAYLFATDADSALKTAGIVAIPHVKIFNASGVEIYSKTTPAATEIRKVLTSALTDSREHPSLLQPGKSYGTASSDPSASLLNALPRGLSPQDLDAFSAQLLNKLSTDPKLVELQDVTRIGDFYRAYLPSADLWKGDAALRSETIEIAQAAVRSSSGNVQEEFALRMAQWVAEKDPSEEIRYSLVSSLTSALRSAPQPVREKVSLVLEKSISTERSPRVHAMLEVCAAGLSKPPQAFLPPLVTPFGELLTKVSSPESQSSFEAKLFRECLGETVPENLASRVLDYGFRDSPASNGELSEAQWRNRATAIQALALLHSRNPLSDAVSRDVVKELHQELANHGGKDAFYDLRLCLLLAELPLDSFDGGQRDALFKVLKPLQLNPYVKLSARTLELKLEQTAH